MSPQGARRRRTKGGKRGMHWLQRERKGGSTIANISMPRGKETEDQEGGKQVWLTVHAQITKEGKKKEKMDNGGRREGHSTDPMGEMRKEKRRTTGRPFLEKKRKGGHVSASRT